VIVGDYWRLLEITREYWRLLEITGEYWRIAAETSGSCSRSRRVSSSTTTPIHQE